METSLIFFNFPEDNGKNNLYLIGFGKEDVVCMFCSNYVEYWLVVLAAWTCGGCVMPVNCELEIEPLEQQLTLAKAKVRYRSIFLVE